MKEVSISSCSSSSSSPFSLRTAFATNELRISRGLFYYAVLECPFWGAPLPVSLIKPGHCWAAGLYDLSRFRASAHSRMPNVLFYLFITHQYFAGFPTSCVDSRYFSGARARPRFTGKTQQPTQLSLEEPRRQQYFYLSLL